MKDYFSSGFKLGILGGGQLGKMLLTIAQQWNLNTRILDPDPEAPARYGSRDFVQGDFTDYQTVYNFGKTVDVLTVEIENVHTGALKKLQDEGISVYPQPSVLEIIKDKVEQKLFYRKHNIPTASFEIFDTAEHVKAAVADKQLTFPSVWKAARGGYDGRGVRLIKNESDVKNLPDVKCIVEEKVRIKREISVIVARNADGAVKTFPAAEMIFDSVAHQVDFVIAPARITSLTEEKAKALAVRIARSFGNVGLLAVEMFITEQDELLVNEVAPRPHNSGHFSREACITDQFEQHLRAVLNLPLGDTGLKIPAVTVNLVGNEGFEGRVKYENLDEALSMEGVSLHVYGKHITRPYRKMGHVTVVHPDVEKALRIARKVKETVRIISE